MKDMNIAFPMALARSRAKLGAQLLDRHRPNWHWDVSMNSLDMRSPMKCVLAQVTGSYSQGRAMTGLNHFQATRHGFDVTFLGICWVGYPHLDEAWLEQIQMRRERDRQAKEERMRRIDMAAWEAEMKEHVQA